MDARRKKKYAYVALKYALIILCYCFLISVIETTCCLVVLIYNLHKTLASNIYIYIYLCIYIIYMPAVFCPLLHDYTSLHGFRCMPVVTG